MAPVILRVQTTGDSVFAPFAEIDNPDDLALSWRVCSKVRDTLESGSRLENLSWRLWHLHQSLMAENKLETPQQFKKISSCAAKRLSKAQFARKPQITKPHHSTENVVIKTKTTPRPNNPKADEMTKRPKKSPQIKTANSQSLIKNCQDLPSPEVSITTTVSALPESHASVQPCASTQSTEMEDIQDVSTQFRQMISQSNSASSPVAAMSQSPFKLPEPKIRTPSLNSTVSQSQNFLSNDLNNFMASPFAISDGISMSRSNSQPLSVEVAMNRINNVMLTSPQAMMFDAMNILPSSALSFLSSLDNQSPGWNMSALSTTLSAPTSINQQSVQPQQQQSLSTLSAQQSQFHLPPAQQQPFSGFTTSIPTPTVPSFPSLSSAPLNMNPSVNLRATTSSLYAKHNVQEPAPLEQHVTPDLLLFEHDSGPDLYKVALSGRTSPTASKKTSSRVGSPPRLQTQTACFPTVNSSDNQSSFSSSFSSTSPLNEFLGGSAVLSALGSNDMTDFNAMDLTLMDDSTLFDAEKRTSSCSPSSIFTGCTTNNEYQAGLTLMSTSPVSLMASPSLLPSTPRNLAASIDLFQSSLLPDTACTETLHTTSIEMQDANLVKAKKQVKSTKKRKSTPQEDKIIVEEPAHATNTMAIADPVASTSQQESTAGSTFSEFECPPGCDCFDHPEYMECANCGVSSTPLWRRGNGNEILCNACGLYLKLHNEQRPKNLKPHGGKKPAEIPLNLECTNCHTRNTPLWRRDDINNPLCNACGLYFKLHKAHRPLKLKKDVVRKRHRHDLPPFHHKKPRPSVSIPGPSRSEPSADIVRTETTAHAPH